MQKIRKNLWLNLEKNSAQTDAQTHRRTDAPTHGQRVIYRTSPEVGPKRYKIGENVLRMYLRALSRSDR